MDEPEEPKDQLPATIASAEVAADQRALNVVPALIADLGDEAAWRYVEFFTAISVTRTRAVPMRARAPGSLLGANSGARRSPRSGLTTSITVMQAVLICNQASASMSTSYFASTAPAVFSGNLATVSVGASLGAAQGLMQGLPTGVGLVTFTGTTTERHATWATSPTAIGAAPIGTPYFDTTLSAQLFSEGLTATGWSSRTAGGV